MLKYIIFITQFFICVNIYTQGNDYVFSLTDGRSLVKKNNKYGVIDTKGQIVLPIEYDSAYSYNEGMAPVTKDGKYYGFVNREGKLTVKDVYDTVGNFSEGIALVTKDQKSGFINKKGEYVIKPDYYGLNLYSFSEELTPIVKPKGFLISIGGKKIAGYKNYKYGYVNKALEFIIKPSFYEAKPFSCGLAAVKLKEGGAWGYINKTGKFVIEPNLELLNPPSFKDNMLKLRFSNSKYGFYNIKGEIAVKPTFSYAEEFSQGRAVVAMPDGFGFIDKKGKFIIKPSFAHAYSFNDDMAAVMNKNNKWGYIGIDGEIKIPYKYDQAVEFSEGLAPVKLNDKWFFINKHGKVITEIKL